MPELRERRFPNFEVVRTDEVSLDFFALVRCVEVAPLGVGKERLFTESLFVVVEPRGDVAGLTDVRQSRILPVVPDAIDSGVGWVGVETLCQSVRL